MVKIIAHSWKLILGLTLPFLTVPLLTVQAAEAAGIVGNGTASSCTNTALNNALAGGGTVSFKCGTLPVTIVVNQKTIAANTVINGGGLVTLSGNGANRIFSVNDGIQLTLQNITLTRGRSADNGGAIFGGYRSRITISGSRLIDNISTKTGEAGGGAIYVKGESILTISNSTFTNNRASLGGAIYNLLSNLTVTGSTFSNNSAGVAVTGTSSGAGGAIYVDGADGEAGKIVLQRNTFTGNIATNQGGAFFHQLYNSNTGLIEDSTFRGNKVTGTGTKGFGGAIFVVGGTTKAPKYTSGINKSSYIIRRSALTANTSANQGGALWTGNNVKAEIVNSTFSGNQAVSPTGKEGLGGAILRASGKVVINNVTIANNYAGFMGAGIFGGNADVTLRNTIIAFNKAGNPWNIKQNCSDAMTNGGNNLQFPARNPNDASDRNCTSGITIADPLLNPLAANGGATQTLSLKAGSPAINRGNNATCAPFDQRIIPRPQGIACDIGAFEVKL